jgi:cysteine-rich repeat protein
MRLGSALLSAVATLGIVVATQGCSLLGGSPETKEERLCTPGAYVFCRCADFAAGTKLCNPDGQSFEACSTDDSGECFGGEIDDPRTNEPVPSPDPDTTDASSPPPAGRDSCPGKSQALVPGVQAVLQGDTTTATNDRQGRPGGACAVGQGANDHVYHLIPSGSGTLQVDVQGSEGLDPLAYVRTSCDDVASQAACAPPLANKDITLKMNVLTGRDYFLVIDGASGSAGKYAAILKLTTASFCGDGKIDANEACDDANKIEGDGCSNDCRKIDGSPASGGSCPGHPVDVWAGQTVTGAGSTSGYGSTFGAPSTTACGTSASGTNSYSDHVYAVTPHATGNLVVTVTAPPSGPLPNFMISARRTCNALGPEAGLCANAATSGASETLTIPVHANEVVYVAVDGGATTNNKGDYSIGFKLE